MPNPDLIPEPFAQSGDKNPIPLERAITDPIYRASWKAGFPPDTRLPKDVGGEGPDGLDFNGVLNILSQAVVFLQKGNAYQFDASLAPYPIGALVRSNDNLTTYQSTVPNNSNNPNSNMTGWRIYNGSGLIVDNLTTNDGNKALSAKQGKVLQDNKLEENKVGVANGVASLDANTKVPVSQLPNASTTAIGAVQLNNTLTSASTTQALSAAQGKVLQDSKLEANKVGVANGVASLDANTKVPVAQLPDASTTAIGAVQLNNTLTSSSTSQALTAAQGKIIADGFTGTKTTNGYQKLLGGLIIQWGYAPKGSSGILSISFPVVFQNACLNIQTQLKHTSQNYQSTAVDNVTKTGFTAYWGNDAVGFFWFAIGY